jgi:hypothetical protein
MSDAQPHYATLLDTAEGGPSGGVMSGSGGRLVRRLGTGRRGGG